MKDFRYYRCSGSDGYRFGGERICGNAQVQGEFLETAVWQEVSDLLTNPDRLEREYHGGSKLAPRQTMSRLLKPNVSSYSTR